MKKFLILYMFSFSILFTGCSSDPQLTVSNGLHAFDGISQEYPIDAKYFAEKASLEIARRYPVATTFRIMRTQERDIFVENFAIQLRQKGFIVDTIDEKQGILLGYVFDSIRRDGEDKVYLQVQLADGTRFGILHPVEQRTNVVNAKIPTTQDGFISVPIQPVKDWSIKRGSLMDQLEQWALSEDWSMIWKADFDLDMKAETTFSGDFVQAVEKLFLALQHADNALRVTVYNTNKVLEVSGE